MLSFHASPEEVAETRTAIAVGLRDGSLRPVVARELPLAEAARAHHHIMERPALGKLVLLP
jgi:NADPH2:quinone reductase